MVEGPRPCTIFFFFTQTISINYLIAMFLLVSRMNACNLLYFARFCARSTPEMAKKKIQQRTLLGFITIFPLLTMIRVRENILIDLSFGQAHILNLVVQNPRVLVQKVLLETQNSKTIRHLIFLIILLAL